MRKGWRVLREQGPVVFARRLRTRLLGDNSVRGSLVRFEDARDADWSHQHPAVSSPVKVGQGPWTIAWVMSPPGANSGGHQNIFRFIKVLEDAGHTVRVYLYTTGLLASPAEVRAMIAASSSYPDVRATIEEYPHEGVPSDTTAIVATGWETAYPSFRDPSLARRFYFVQDFEPAFYPVGSESVLAENSYRFGFHGLTAGHWLADKLADDYGMQTDAFDFGSDASTYFVENSGHRREILFYARPATERRGFDLGIMALDLVAAARPEVTINLVGEDVRHRAIPFAYTNLSGLQVGDLNAVYNRSAVALVLSFTNMSLLPLELLGAGTIPVVNDGPNNRGVSDNPFIEFTPASPRALADRIIELYDRGDLPEHAQRAAESVASADWAHSGRQFLSAFERIMHG